MTQKACVMHMEINENIAYSPMCDCLIKSI